MMIRLIARRPTSKELLPKLLKWLEKTRFHIWPYSVEARPHEKAGPRFKGGDILLSAVRLKEAKFYHGNTGTTGPVFQQKGWTGVKKPHRKTWLEGADWVEFNDILNDFLDHHRIRADVQSRACVIRKGFKRRIVYDMVRMSSRWDKSRMVLGWALRAAPEHYVNLIDAAVVPFSKFTPGTPGIYRDIYRHPADGT